VTIVCIALRRRGRLSRVFPWLLIGLLAALSLTFRGSIAARLTDDDLGAAHSRVPLMETASRIIADNPVLGVAANNYTAVLPDYASRHQDNEFLYTVHNQYLLVWVETGLVGLAAFLWFLIATIRRGYDRWKRSDVLLSPLALGFTAALAGQMVHMQADLFNGRPQLQLLMTVAAAIGAMSRIGTRDC
jgi:O-antigen ligase